MNNLYLWLNFGSFIIPFLFSFHPKLQFYKKWRSFFIGVFIMMLVFIPWDVVFTSNGFWGFNDTYITGVKLFHLPVEEWLFFICIPYACVFTHYSLYHFFPKLAFSEKLTNIIYVSLLCVLIITLWYHFDKWYTLINFFYAIVLLGIVYNYNKSLLRKFLPTFLVILIPFFIVNGVLTGSWIDNQVVWYNDAENLGIRMGTIPIEDSVYALGMLLTVYFVTEILENKRKRL
ncbi:lycopene cyclase domain-containing protein [Patiriisocius hiemis]|uniref:Lycopene cyclase domain-containing protein n=1 Tax=Patiriisocius hiemis TaxID=3075604 RepID=A0ABU2YCX6_9FLAO|nr:lycopene cyclase domain-containing protein [Constantimarinum sp. W242]MDT0555731.1 lycopene cyclase domain-containing protein [Constantimarinum sp. W242]